MERRTLLALVAAVLGVMVIVLAAGSSPVRVWSDPPPGELRPIEVVTTEVSDTVPPIGQQAPPDDGTNHNPVLRVLAAVGLAVLVWLAVVVITTWARALSRVEWRRRRATAPFTPLPEIATPEVALDIVAARGRLAEGTPRNAIVACWLQLERDAADAGFERDPAETSAEYTRRVVSAASVDPGPIEELAALYREARFSRHELDDTHRERAVEALGRVASALPQREDVAS